MDTLSLEIVELIASLLPLHDAVRFSMSCRIARAACRRRIEPDSYLVKTFRTPRYLLAAMTDFGCVLSGSRALEYFVPGSASESSDWDFLVPCVESSTLGMMDALEKCGVEWEDPFDSVMSLIASLQKSGTAIVRAAALISVRPELFASRRRPRPTREQREMYELLYDFVFQSLYGHYTSWIRVDIKVRNYPELAAMGPAWIAKAYKNTTSKRPLKDSNYNMDVDLNLDDILEIDNHANIRGSRTSELSANSAVVKTSTSVYKLTEVFRNMLLHENINPLTGHADDFETCSISDTMDAEEYNEHNLSKPVKLINGYIKPTSASSRSSRQERQKVQLFQCHSRINTPCTPLEYIVNSYYATHVQCFISGWAAGHFFYDLARQKLAITWGLEIARARQHARRMCIRKYRERGFRFFVSGSLELELDDNLDYFVHATEVKRGNSTLCRTGEVFPGARQHDSATAQHDMIVEAVAAADFAALRAAVGDNNDDDEGEEEMRSPTSPPHEVESGSDNNMRPQFLSHEGYDTLYAAVHPGAHSDQARLRAQDPAPPNLDVTSVSRRLGDKGTLLVRFHRLQKTMWLKSICGNCRRELECAEDRLAVHSQCCLTRNTMDPYGDVPRGFVETEWQRSSFRHYQTLCRSLDMFRWHLTMKRSLKHARDFQLQATEPVLPHMARWHYPYGVSKFGNGIFHQPVSMGIMAAERASAASTRSSWGTLFDYARARPWDPHKDMVKPSSYSKFVGSAPRAWSLRDIFAAGVLAKSVPISEDNNLTGVSAEAVAQAYMPWNTRGKLRVRNGKRAFFAVDNQAGNRYEDEGGEADEDGFTQVESREEQWTYFRYLLTATPTACTATECRWLLVNMLPPQI